MRRSEERRLIDAAKLGASMFQTKTRDSGGAFVTRMDDAPEWLTDVCREAHNDMLPDDWKYAAISAAFDRLAECDETDDLDDVAHEWADGYVDVYNSDLADWLASHNARGDYCDEARKEWGSTDGADTWTMLQRGQYREAHEVFDLVLAGLRERLDDIGPEDEDDEEETE
jgi:hypothetical protein